MLFVKITRSPAISAAAIKALSPHVAKAVLVAFDRANLEGAINKELQIRNFCFDPLDYNVPHLAVEVETNWRLDREDVCGSRSLRFAEALHAALADEQLQGNITDEILSPENLPKIHVAITLTSGVTRVVS